MDRTHNLNPRGRGEARSVRQNQQKAGDELRQGRQGILQARELEGEANRFSQAQRRHLRLAWLRSLPIVAKLYKGDRDKYLSLFRAASIRQ